MLLLATLAAMIESGAMLLHVKYALVFDTSLLQTAILAYFAVIALDEIDFRGLLRRIAENRFHRIAMSLGDGLVCTDQNHAITVWNHGATAIFGYDADEMIGKPFDLLWTPMARRSARRPGEMHGARWQADRCRTSTAAARNGEMFPVEASFSAWQGSGRPSLRCDPARRLGPQARGRAHPLSRRI